MTATTGGGFVIAVTDASEPDNNLRYDVYDGLDYISSAFVDATDAIDVDFNSTTLANGNLAFAWTRVDANTGATTIMYYVGGVSGNVAQNVTSVPAGGVAGSSYQPTIVTTPDGFAILYTTQLSNQTGTDIQGRSVRHKRRVSAVRTCNQP